MFGAATEKMAKCVYTHIIHYYQFLPGGQDSERDWRNSLSIG